MLGLRLRVHDVLPGLAALKPRRIRRMTTDQGRELLCNIQGPIAARLIAISQARFASGGSTNIISIFRRSSRPICRSPDSLQEMAGPPPSPCASHSEVSGDWERGNLTKCESKFASPQSSPSKSCNEPVSYDSLFRISAISPLGQARFKHSLPQSQN